MRTSLFLFGLLSFTLLGCSTSKALLSDEEIRQADVVALSGDGSWALTISTRDSIRFLRKGSRDVVMPWKRPQVIGDSRVFRTMVGEDLLMVRVDLESCRSKDSSIHEGKVLLTLGETGWEECADLSDQVLSLQDIWRVDSILGRPYTDFEEGNNNRPYIEFQPNKGMAMGHSGCNSWHGNVWIGGESIIHLGSMIVTEMYCKGSSEEIFFEAWNSADRWIRDGLRLYLFHGAEKVMVLHKVD
ncbi:MAG: META domain-containing protein [Bacteroidota bacterium]|nr:META domain-containing protein [Bacteroidota bacterium]